MIVGSIENFIDVTNEDFNLTNRNELIALIESFTGKFDWFELLAHIKNKYEKCLGFPNVISVTVLNQKFKVHFDESLNYIIVFSYENNTIHAVNVMIINGIFNPEKLRYRLPDISDESLFRLISDNMYDVSDDIYYDIAVAMIACDECNILNSDILTFFNHMV